MSVRNEGGAQTVAAAKSGFSERTARRVEQGGGRLKPREERHWRTRGDPFEAVWDGELVGLLESQPKLSATTLLEYLQGRYPDEYPDSLKRTLQRRVQLWRALNDGTKEVMFRQTHEPGQMALSDFTLLKDVVVTIQGLVLVHLLYHFRLLFSGWCYVRVVLGGESFTALGEGLQEALWRLGGSPREHRTDSLSAAYRNLSKDDAEDQTQRYAALCEHYSMRPSRNNRGVSHENGGIESPHGSLKWRIAQALMLRGSNDFDSVQVYQGWLEETVVKPILRRNRARIVLERAHLGALPVRRTTDYSEMVVAVTSSSTLTVKCVLYTVPSRLVGARLRVHVYDDRLKCYIGTTLVLELPRVYPLRGRRRARRVDYRHVIEALVRKPGAFRGCIFRDELLPSASYRRIWEALDARLAPRVACKLMVGILALAARHDCERALGEHVCALLERARLPTLLRLEKRFAATLALAPPALEVEQHQLSGYDILLPSNGCHQEVENA